MAKIKIKFKIQGLELEIEGERDAVPQAARAIGRQFGSMLGSPQNVIEAEEVQPANSRPELTPPVVPAPKKRSRAGSSSKGASKSDASVEALDFKHDPSQYGNPPASWNSATKAVWLLRVLEKQANTSELSGGAVAATFNKHFGHAGAVQGFNVNRDLRKMRSSMPVYVNENTVDPAKPWSLTPDGKTYADKLIEQARTGTTSK